MIEFIIPLDPVPCPRPRMTKTGKVYYPKRYNTFKGAARGMMPGVLMSAGLHSPVKYLCMVFLDCVVKRPKKTKLQVPKPDVDNYAKAVLDACNGWVWDDDTQVVALEVRKMWAEPGHPGEIRMQVEKVAHLQVVNTAPPKIDKDTSAIQWLHLLRWAGNEAVPQCPWCHGSAHDHVDEPCEFQSYMEQV